MAGQTHNGVRRTQSCLNTHSISTAPDAGRHQGSGFTAPEPSPAEASHRPKRHMGSEEGSRSFKRLRQTTSRPTRLRSTALDKRNGNNVRRRRECIRIQDQAHSSDVASGKSDRQPARNVVTVPRAEDPRPRFLAVSRPGFADSAQSVVEQPLKNSVQHIDLIVISDTERDSGEEDE